MESRKLLHEPKLFHLITSSRRFTSADTSLLLTLLAYYLSLEPSFSFSLVPRMTSGTCDGPIFSLDLTRTAY